MLSKESYPIKFIPQKTSHMSMSSLTALDIIILKFGLATPIKAI